MENSYDPNRSFDDRLPVYEDKVGRIGEAQLREIANEKMPDLNTEDVEQAVKIIAGTAKNMGVEVEE